MIWQQYRNVSDHFGFQQECCHQTYGREDFCQSVSQRADYYICACGLFSVQPCHLSCYIVFACENNSSLLSLFIFFHFFFFFIVLLARSIFPLRMIGSFCIPSVPCNASSQSCLVSCVSPPLVATISLLSNVANVCQCLLMSIWNIDSMQETIIDQRLINITTI